MEQPRGFEEGGDNMWRLQKTLYRTMQGAHDQTQNLDKTFEGHGYYRSKADPQICSRVQNDEFTLTSTWTDDILGASSTLEGETLVKEELAVSYELKDIGEAKLILGMRINRNPSSSDITLSQRAYCKCMLYRFRMDDYASTSIPLPVGSILSIDNCPRTPKEMDEMKDIPYREALGSFIWLQVAT